MAHLKQYPVDLLAPILTMIVNICLSKLIFKIQFSKNPYFLGRAICNIIKLSNLIQQQQTAKFYFKVYLFQEAQYKHHLSLFSYACWAKCNKKPYVPTFALYETVVISIYLSASLPRYVITFMPNAGLAKTVFSTMLQCFSNIFYTSVTQQTVPETYTYCLTCI